MYVCNTGKNKGCLIKTGRNDLDAHKTNTVDRFDKKNSNPFETNTRVLGTISSTLYDKKKQNI